MKKVLCLFLAVIMLFSLTGCAVIETVIGSAVFLFLVVTGDNSANKDEIFTFVQENEEVLLKAIEENDFAAFENQGFIHGINAEDEVVDFDCGGAGVGSGTSYVGFFHSPEGDMTAIWCAPSSADSLTASGNGFVWQEEQGDNRCYIEQIRGNFYYYEASY